MRRDAPMFVIFAVTVGVFQVFRTPAGAAEDMANVGARFVTLLAKEDFAGAVAQFDAAMKTAMPEPKLRETWHDLLGKAGAFQRQTETAISTASGYDIVLVTCQFERTALDVKVVLDGAGKVAGLFFVPAHEVVDTKGPAYAPSTAYREKDVMVGHGEWSTHGTLTLPSAGAGPWPAVVLVHGSGPNDRDETVGANKPFRDLAWGLASNGIAVLRYEKRTKEHADTLKTKGLAGFTVKEETIDDAVSAAAQLRTEAGVDAKRVYVLGHSLGGALAPRIAKADGQLAGVIILAGETRPLEDAVVEQTRYLMSLQEKPTAADEANLAAVEAAAAAVKRLTPADSGSATVTLGAAPSYWLDLRHYDALTTAKALKLPMLILRGDRDYQVTTVDFERWKEALRTKASVTFKSYPELNHLFIAGKGKSTPREYAEAGHVAEAVVRDIAGWIHGQDVKR